MGVTTYYYKGKTTDQTKGLTEIYPSVSPKMVLIIGHGIGERNSGDLAGCKLSSGWGGWANIKLAADVYGVIQIYINTSSNYENGEYQFALAWAKKKYSALGLSNKIWVLGHSLGSYGAGRYAFKDVSFCQQIAGWIMSAAGNFIPFATTDSINLYENLVNNGVKVWGVMAENDTVTTSAVLTNLYNNVKALDANARIIKSMFPSTEWPAPDLDDKAHNAVLGRITQRPMYYSGGNFKLITAGLTTSNNIVMNIYQWMISNPRTSIYQDPTQAYVGPQYSTPQNTTIEIKDINWDIVRRVGLLTWMDGSSEYIKAADGDALVNVYERRVSGKWVVTSTFTTAPASTKGPYKT